MKDLYKCDACGAYHDPDSLACARCEREVAAARREWARQLQVYNETIGGQDERNYAAG